MKTITKNRSEHPSDFRSLKTRRALRCAGWVALGLLASAGRLLSATVTVSVGTGGGLFFTPDTVSIQPGDTVMWV